MVQIKCQNLSVGYDDSILFQNLNFTISKGNYICIIGENGAGKSTLMKTILGLKQALSGQITLENGVNRTQFGYLTQQKDIQKDFPASVNEIVLSGCQSKCGLRPFYSKKEKFLAKEAMEKLSIYALKDKCFRELSGGQQQRVLIARAICATEKVLFLDEPATGLDINISADLYAIVDELNKTQDVSIVMISHDIQTALQYATHILYIGKNMFFGTKEEYLASNSHLRFYKENGGESNA